VTNPEPSVSAARLRAYRDVVPGYYINAIEDCIARCGGFAGKRVLEIGGSSLPRELVLDVLGAEQWVCIDILNHDSGRYQREAQSAHYSAIGVRPLRDDVVIPDEPYVIYDGSAEFVPASFDGQFDLVFSINSFEHILPLPRVLERCHASLRGAGQLFSQFGPIWSGVVGSHFWVNEGFNFNHPEPLPPWAHLLMSRTEIDAHLRTHGMDDDTVHQALYQIFESSFVNRRFFEDYEQDMAESPFPAFAIEPLWSGTVPPTQQLRLEARHPGRREFGAYGMRIVAQRQVQALARSVLICGAGRSGTSALAGMVDQGSHFHGDNLFPASPSNPKGFFENYDINDLNEELLLRSATAHMGSEAVGRVYGEYRRGQYWLARWPEAMTVLQAPDLQTRIRALVQRQPLCFKDPRFSVTAPAWLEELPQAVVLCIFRPPAVTAESILHECRSADYLLDHRISVVDAFELWRLSYRRMVRLYASGAQVLFVRYADLFDPARLRALEAQLGLPLVRSFAEGALDRTHSPLVPSPACQALHELLEGLSAAQFGASREAGMALLKAFETQEALGYARAV
jgi:hypothetical protein